MLMNTKKIHHCSVNNSYKLVILNISLLAIIFTSCKLCISGDCQNGYGKQIIEDIGGRPCSRGIYNGKFTKGEYNGSGVIKCSMHEYSGEWKNGLQHGKGKLTIDDGTSYQGIWVNGWMVDGLKGNVNIQWKDGTRYAGYFQDSHPAGKCAITMADGRMIEGTINPQDNYRYRLVTSSGDVYHFIYDDSQESKNYFIWIQQKSGSDEKNKHQ